MRTPFHLLILKTYHAQRNRVRPSMAEIGLSPGQPKLLGYLVSVDHCMQKELAEACEIEPATVSKLLNGMEETGLVLRSAAEGDKRAGCVSITEKGRKLQEQAKGRFDQIVGQELSGFTEKEKEEFTSYLCRMYHNLTGREIK